MGDVPQLLARAGALKVVGHAAGCFGQGFGAERGQHQQLAARVRSCVPGGGARLGGGFEDEVGVGSGEAEAGDPGDGRPVPLRQRGGVGGYGEWQVGPVDGGVGVLQVQVGRDRLVLQAQHGLDETGDSGGCLGVADVGLH